MSVAHRRVSVGDAVALLGMAGLLIGVVVAACFLAGCSTTANGDPAAETRVAAPAHQTHTTYMAFFYEDLATVREKFRIWSPVTISFEDLPGLTCQGYYRRDDYSIKVYTLDGWFNRLSDRDIRYVIRHELMHYADHACGVPSPDGPHMDTFDKRIKEIWP